MSDVSETTENRVEIPEPEQQLVYDLMRGRLMRLFGPGGSFRVTLGRATDAEAVFASTVADTVSWDVVASLAGQRSGSARHQVPRDPRAEHEALWDQIESELMIRRTGPVAFFEYLAAQTVPSVLAVGLVVDEDDEPATDSSDVEHDEDAVISDARTLSSVRAA